MRHWKLLAVVALLLFAVVACSQSSTPPEQLAKNTEKAEKRPTDGEGAGSSNRGIAPGGQTSEERAASGGASPVAGGSGRPNVILVLTDDLDARPTSISHMPNLQRQLVDHGTTFDNAFVTNALCCPSRATILRGQYSHNHGVLTNKAPLGGEQRFSELGREDSTVATWLHSEGYSTVMFGKYLNHFKPPVPPGWDLWFGRGIAPPGAYETDYYAYEAAKFIENASDETQPFFMWLCTTAPHANVEPPPRYDDAFPDSTAPRPPSFNEEDVSDKPKWLQDKPLLTENEIAGIDEQYRNRLRTLLAVDDMIGTLFKALEKSGELDSTYVFFTSDNGYVMGEHRRPHGKWSAYEEAMRVPLIVRGPGVPEGRTLPHMVLNNDLAPTFAALGDAPVPSFTDGRSFVPLLGGSPPSPSSWRAAFLEEAVASGSGRPAFEAIRTTDHLWVEYVNGERELYDLRDDPYELDSRHRTAPSDLKQDLAGRLDELRDCSGEGCSDAEGF